MHAALVVVAEDLAGRREADPRRLLPGPRRAAGADHPEIPVALADEAPVREEQRRGLFSVLFVLAAGGCAGGPPSGWVRGGTPLDLPRARWIVGEQVVDVTPDGSVLYGGDRIFRVDAAGRISDEDGDPVAVLEPDGRLVGSGDKDLGLVGAGRAARGGEDTAWIAVLPTGEVVRYDDDGGMHPFGAWVGCAVSPRAVQLCTLVTHLLVEQLASRQAALGGGMGFGMGFGVGVPIR